MNTTIQIAKQWYTNNGIKVIQTDDGRLCLPVRDGFLLELSDNEINDRAELILASELEKITSEH